MFDGKDSHLLSPDLLRTFVAATDSGSFTGAARLVNRTQSAVSMQIKRLEDELGCVFFERRARGVVLTADGETLYRYALRILRLYDEAAASLSAPETKGVIRFGTPEDYASTHLPVILKRFAEVFPLVRVDVLCDTSPRLLEALTAGELDLCLCTSSHGLEGGRSVGKMALCWIGPERGFSQSDEPLPLAVFHEGCTYRRWALEALEKAKVNYRIAYASPGVAGVLAAVRAGLAVAPLTRSIVAPGCRIYGNAEGMPPLPAVTMSLHLSAGAQPEIVDRFASHVTEAIRETKELVL
ncbi:LysR substrate-binding domain-containing protein [Desulfovibrio ferrophilus]|uniref:Transcriptional regulator, LysR family n=1 Tax=Desulfovibrio ferrophilus TaxID=241368 RepID=A0A2Z6AX06_9BACT|nr:LysR substrate-binding domain-containing protein [Desulfovibrio ferrophilus]BBD07733.1 transcriptional regulator, LysR family [Desulfovibrio ferrophilus]